LKLKNTAATYRKVCKMKKVIIEGKQCIGPNFTQAEFILIKRNLDTQKGLDTLAGLLETSGSLQRLKILYLLYAHKEMCVCDISEVLEISDSAVSQHLRKLKDKNLVRPRRHRQTIYYSLVTNPFTKFIGALFTKEELKESYSFVQKEGAF
jgi:ArsR family transcriptional regulator, lead/cadmium/zinc/bismuth-responsive transcriptional repressor